ncbi:hypothetical protein QBC46DRAFT_274947, partial [Diplogelasinospora grovesii]
HNAFLKNNLPLINEFTPNKEFTPGAFNNDNSNDDIRDNELKSKKDEEDNYL